MIIFLIATLLLLLLACGAPADAAPGVMPSEVTAGQAPVQAQSYTPVPTATPWPTFTPAPTPTAAPVPFPTNPPGATATPWPRFSPDPVSGESPSGGGSAPEPSSVPAGELHRNGVFLLKQGLSPFRGGDLPGYLEERDWDRMPPPAPVIAAGVRYMLWVVAFDFSQASPGYEAQGLVRWLSVLPGVGPVVIFETSMTVSARSPFFYHGLGGGEPGIWTPGSYRVEFLDSGGDAVAQAQFEVRR